jgi:hypothetical protein
MCHPASSLLHDVASIGLNPPEGFTPIIVSNTSG